MFAADLSWIEGGSVEKVGERKQRKARERSTPSLSETPSIRSSRSSRNSVVSSVADDREMWWTTGLKKAKSLRPQKMSRPTTSWSTATHAIQHSRQTSASIPETTEAEGVTSNRKIRDPSLQPSFTYSSTISSRLPSGAPLDPPVHEVPELEGDVSSRYTGSSGESRSSHERQWSLKGPGRVKVIDEVHEVQQWSPQPFVTRNMGRNIEAAEPIQTIPVLATPSGKKKARSVKVEGCLDLGRLKLQDEPGTEAAPIQEHTTYAEVIPDSDIAAAAWRPPSSWSIHLSKENRLEKQEASWPLPALDGISVAHNNLLEMTRFQRFIRRMESAGPRVICDRLKEEWHDPVDEEANEELLLEKQLWVLTAFQLQNLGTLEATPKPECNTGKIMELSGSLAEVFQLSAMHSRHKVHYVTTEPKRPMPLPGNVSYLTVPHRGLVTYPWPDATFSHIRASTLPSLVPSSKLPELLRECHRLLAPGGMLEIRIMDAAPVRKTAGPKMRAWIEDRLTLNLERCFRCTKPCMLLPAWVAEAGFELSNHANDTQVMRLPCAVDNRSSDVDMELKALVGRALWRDIWGSFVDEEPDEAAWWWEDEEVMQECLERQTVFECGAIYAFKK